MSASEHLSGQFKRIGMPKTPQEFHDHMVDEHGHDDVHDNPDLKGWGTTEWTEQHDEDHENDYHEHEH